MLQVTTLGNLCALLDGMPVAPLTNTKPLALWLYLALEGRVSRAALASLFWGELDDAAARANLRFALTRLRQHLPGYVDADRSEVWIPATARWSLDLDVLVDDAPASSLAVPTLLGLRVERFLAGPNLRSAPEFEDWLAARRRQLADAYFACLDRLAAQLREAGDTRGLIEVHRRCLLLEPWSEAQHAALIEAYVELGQVAAAVAQYDTCCEVLERELGTAPGPALAALGTRLSRLRAETAPPPSAVAAPPFAGLPHVVRAAEEMRLVELLRGEAARVVSIVGPGGAGKTHLARAVAHALVPAFADGVHFIALAGQESSTAPRRLIDLIAEQTGGTLAPGDESESLLAHLGPRHALLVLDNFETWNDAAGLIAEIARRAPRVRVLITTRHRTGLATEWCVPLGGLAVPDPGAPLELALQCPACDLFLQHARRLAPELSPAREGAAIVAICRAVDGLPLAIVLAAHWMPTLSCADIAQRLAVDAGLFDEPSPAPLPERHRSLAAVLEESWQLLDADERAAFSAVSLFRGGFTAANAIEVTDCALGTLERLMSKSLLREREGRLEVHPLLRELGSRKLAASRHQRARLQRALAAHFHSRLNACRRQLAVDGHGEGFADLQVERGNLVAVFEWLLTQPDLELLTDYLEGLWSLHRLHGWFDEGAALLRQALSLPGLPREIFARWQLWLSDACFQAERHAECRAATLACLLAHGEQTPERGAPGLRMTTALAATLIGAHRDRPGLSPAAVDDVARAHNRLAQVYFYEGDRPRFVTSTLASITYRHAAELAPLLASGALVLAYTPFKRRAARYAARAERALASAHGFERAWAHEQLCLYYLGGGELTAARAHGNAGRELCRRLQQHKNWGECTALVANAHLMQGEFEAARQLMAELKCESRRVGIPANEMWGLCGETFIDLCVSNDVPAGDFDRAQPLIAGTVDPNTHLLYYGILAWWHTRRGEFELAIEALRRFGWIDDRASMLSIYVLNGFVAATLAALGAHGATQGRDTATARLAALCPPLLRRCERLAAMQPAVGTRALHLRGQWLLASGRHARGSAMMRRALASLPPDIDAEAFARSLGLPAVSRAS